MKSLLLLRHAKSSWADPALGDHDRPLNPRGKRDALQIGRLLRERALQPQQVLSSTALRAHKTAQRVLEASGCSAPLQLDKRLYHAAPQTFIEVLQEQPDAVECLLLVGHNPGLEDLLAQLVQDDQQLPTAALAHVGLPIDHWRELSLQTRGALRDLWRPKELP